MVESLISASGHNVTKLLRQFAVLRYDHVRLRYICRGYRRTEDGNAYPLDFPWGQLGSVMNGVCLSVVYQHLDFDAGDSAARVRNRCFLQRQMGYFFNHKCDAAGSSCNTPDDAGFSYMVGWGSNFQAFKLSSISI